MAQNAITAQQVIYGSHGELWIDGNYIAEVLEVKGTVTFDKVEVKITKKMGKHYKYVG